MQREQNLRYPTYKQLNRRRRCTARDKSRTERGEKEACENDKTFCVSEKGDKDQATDQTKAAGTREEGGSIAMRMALAIGVTALMFAALAYFLYGLVWFLVVGRKKQQPRANHATAFGFLAVAVAFGLWFVGLAFFGSPGWHSKLRLLLLASLGLCVAAMGAARAGERRTAIPIIAAALVVALNWIGTFLRE
jgi:vacuolar-type H+-ATPase subunit I/STV1